MAKSIRTARSYLAFVYDAGGGTSYRVSGKAIVVTDGVAVALTAYAATLSPPIEVVVVDSVNPPTPPDTNYVTQDELATAIGGVTVPAASTTVAGKVELATPTETLAGTDGVRAVTPAGLQAVRDALPDTFAPRPAGGADGQALVKSGSDIVWGTVTATLPEGTLNTARAALAAGKRLVAANAGTQRQNTRAVVSAITSGTGLYGAAPSPLETTISTGATYVESTKVWTNTAGAHGLAVGDRVRFSMTGRTGLSQLGGNQFGYVLSVPSSSTWTMTQTVGGTSSPSNGTDGTVTAWYKNWPTSYPGWVIAGQTVTITAATDVWTTPLPHNLTVGQSVRVTGSTATGVANDTTYYVISVPTTTTFTVAAVASGTVLNVTGDGTAVLSQQNPLFLFSDFRATQRAASSPTNEYAQSDFSVITVGAGVGGSGAISLTAVVDQDRFELPLFNDNANQIEVTIDGVVIDVITAAQLAAAGVSSGNTGSKVYTFPDARARVVTIRGVVLAGLRVPAGTKVARAVLPNRGAFWLFIGDSFTEGAGSTALNILGYVAKARRFLGLTNVWQAGAGTTGYLKDGTRVALVTRYQNDIINQRPDVVVIAMGLNDDRTTLTQRSDCVTAATTIWGAITTQLPVTELVIVGPWSPKGIGTNGTDYRDANLVLLDLALQVAALARGLRYISPIQEGWITGNGKVGTTTGLGNADIFTSSDGTHPSDAGHEYLGWRLAGHLATPFA